MQHAASGDIARTYGDGRWFPRDGNRLRDMVENFLDAAAIHDIDGRIVAALAPHAGFVYSGAVAGHTFRALRDSAQAAGAPNTVVIVGFTHRERFPGVALLDAETIQTPIGTVPLDRESAEFLAGCDPCITFDSAPHAGEHSAENEIPFVQVALPDVPLVVALMGDHSRAVIAALATALSALSRTRGIVVIASTDMLHSPDYDLVTQTDQATLSLLKAMNLAQLQDEWSPAHQPVCGLGPVSVALSYARDHGVEHGDVLCYRNSGDDHPESRGEWVVGYGAVAYLAREA